MTRTTLLFAVLVGTLILGGVEARGMREPAEKSAIEEFYQKKERVFRRLEIEMDRGDLEKLVLIRLYQQMNDVCSTGGRAVAVSH
jgi:hypothetical protein